MSIIAEVIATTTLKASDGFSRFWPSLIVIVGYAVSFWGAFAGSKNNAIGYAYAIWSGLGSCWFPSLQFIFTTKTRFTCNYWYAINYYWCFSHQFIFKSGGH